MAALAAALLVLAGLTSCTPVVRGITGLAADADGQPLAALAWCAERPPDVVLFFAEKDSTSPALSASAASWPSWPERREYAVPSDATSPTTVHLPGFPSEPGTDPQPVFRLRGVAYDNSFTSLSVTFQLTELAGLRTGSVLITDFVDNDEVQKVISLDEFAELGRAVC